MPNWFSLVQARLRELTGGPPDPDIVEELAAHFAQLHEHARAQGLSDPEAERHVLALLEASQPFLQALGAKRAPMARRIDTWARQEAPPPQGRGLMAKIDLSRDSRYALRMLLRAPVFSLIAIVTFAIGIGVNTAVFSVVNAVLLQALPYPDAGRITMVWLDNQRQGLKEDITSYPNYLDWRDQNSVYEHLAAYTPASFSLTGAGEPERLRGAYATANFFDVMGLPPAVGRVFTSEHETQGRDGVVVLSHGLWQRRFGGAPNVIGQTITLNGTPHEVIGVMRPEMRWPLDAELWKPLAPDQDDRQARFSFWLPVIGRLKPGAAVEQAQTEMSGISDRLVQAYPNMKGFGAYVVPLKQQLVGGVERGLLVLMGAVGCVLLIACVNLANLMLGRTATRRRELAIRTALGASRWRLVRQIVTEALVLALIGGGLGLVLAHWATGFFVGLAADSLPRADTIRLDARVLLFAFALAAIAALLAGLVPALHASRSAAAEHLREGGRQGGGMSSRRTRSVLVAVEVALALVLLTGAGLLMRTLWNMQQLDRGFNPSGVAVATVSAPPSAYPRAPEVRGFYSRVLERVRALPGVESAALASGVLQPLLANSSVFSIEGKPLPPPEERIEYPFEAVSPGFFDTLRVQVVRGRGFDQRDHADAPRVVVINETLARHGWPGEDPIGKRIRFGGGDQAPWMTVIGVVRDLHRNLPQRPVRPELYFSSLQNTPRTQLILVRTAGDPRAVIPSIRREVQAIDPQLPLFAVNTLEGAIDQTLGQPRFQSSMLAAFAAIALLLASIGIYGVTAHAVGQRTQEVGIRMALGARGPDVLRLIFTQHLRPALIGIAIGIGAALALGRSLQSLLYGVRATDPSTFAIMALSLLAVAAAACWIPARRAMRVDPLVALRAE